MECFSSWINQARVKVLDMADTIVAGYIIKLFIVYLSEPSLYGGKKNSHKGNNVTTLSYITAATVVNVFWGFVYILPVVFSRIARSSGKVEFRVLCYSCLSYCIGLVLLAVSSSEGGLKRPVAFYVSLLFLAKGMAGLSATRESFEKKQKKGDLFGKLTRCCFKVCAFLGVQMAGTMIDFLPRWPIKYAFAAAFMAGFVLIFFTGTCCCRYNYGEFEETNPEIILPSCLRNISSCLCKRDESSRRSGELERPRREAELETHRDAEITVHLIPMFMTFIICGVVCSTVYTILLAQAASMQHQKFLSFLLFFYNVGKANATFYSKLGQWLLKCFHKRSNEQQQFPPTFGIGLAMLYSVLATIVAALVEKIRKNNPKSSMSMWWLVPQSLAVGVLDGTYHASIDSFLVDGLSSTAEEDIPMFANVVFGAGFMGNALLVFIVSKATDWIPKNFEASTSSELEKYYWLLVVLSSICLVAYILIAICFQFSKCCKTTTSSAPSGPKPDQPTGPAAH